MEKRLDGDLLLQKGAGSAKLEAKSIMMQVHNWQLSLHASVSGLERCEEERECIWKEKELLEVAR